MGRDGSRGGEGERAGQRKGKIWKDGTQTQSALLKLIKRTSGLGRQSGHFEAVAGCHLEPFQGHILSIMGGSRVRKITLFASITPQFKLITGTL